MNVDTLRARLTKYPKLPLTNSPTPIQSLPRFQALICGESGPSIWIKRDDEIGPGLGGNKGRKLEFLMAEVVEQKKKKVVTFGGLQSNHARMTAAACAALGLEAHLIYFDRKPKIFSGNLLLNEVFGAKIHFLPIGSSGGSMTLETTNRLVRLVSWPLTGIRTFFIPVGGHSIIGCLGYVEAACEIIEQLKIIGLEQEKVTIVMAAGTGGTLAGLLAGFTILQSPIKLLGIDIGNLWRGFPESIARLSIELCRSLGTDFRFEPKDIPIIENTYVGKAYAHPSEIGRQAMYKLAKTEGIILDPVYTGKALAGLIDLVNKRFFDKDDHVIFLHSGGFPALGAIV